MHFEAEGECHSDPDKTRLGWIASALKGDSPIIDILFINNAPNEPDDSHGAVPCIFGGSSALYPRGRRGTGGLAAARAKVVYNP